MNTKSNNQKFPILMLDKWGSPIELPSLWGTRVLAERLLMAHHGKSISAQFLMAILLWRHEDEIITNHSQSAACFPRMEWCGVPQWFCKDTAYWQIGEERHWADRLPFLFSMHSVSSVFAMYPVFCLYYNFSYSGTWPSCLTDLISLRLVGEVGARIIVKSSYSQRGPATAWILTVASFPCRTSPLIWWSWRVRY